MIINRKLFSKNKLSDKEKEKREEKLRKGASIIAGTGAGLLTAGLSNTYGLQNKKNEFLVARIRYKNLKDPVNSRYKVGLEKLDKWANENLNAVDKDFKDKKLTQKERKVAKIVIKTNYDKLRNDIVSKYNNDLERVKGTVSAKEYKEASKKLRNALGKRALAVAAIGTGVGVGLNEFAKYKNKKRKEK